MNALTTSDVVKHAKDSRQLACYVAGRKIKSDNILTVRSPYDGREVGSVMLAVKETRSMRASFTNTSATSLVGPSRTLSI